MFHKVGGGRGGDVGNHKEVGRQNKHEAHKKKNL